MATTYTLISSNVLTGSAASVTFSSIPSTYTDLVLRVSARDTNPSTDEVLSITFNGTSTGYSYTLLRGTGSAANSTRGSSAAAISLGSVVDGDGATANTFSNAEIYIPSYTVSQNKPIGGFGVTETNATAIPMAASAGLWSNTATISSLTLTTGVSFKTGSSFYLYGIKNS